MEFAWAFEPIRTAESTSKRSTAEIYQDKATPASIGRLQYAIAQGWLSTRERNVREELQPGSDLFA